RPKRQLRSWPDEAFDEPRGSLLGEVERLDGILERPAVGVERGEIDGSLRQKVEGRAQRGDVRARLSLVSVDDVDALPVPALHVDGARSVSVIAGDDEA